MVPLLTADLVFLASNLTKFLDGGWVTVVIAGIITIPMRTWGQGTFILNSRARKRERRIDKFIREYQTLFPGLAARCTARRSSSPQTRTARPRRCCRTSGITRFI